MRIYQVIIASPGLAGCLFVKIQLVQPTLFRLLRCFCSKGRNIQSIARQCVPSYPLFWTEKTEHSGLSKSRCSVLFRYFYSKRRNIQAVNRLLFRLISCFEQKRRNSPAYPSRVVPSFFGIFTLKDGTLRPSPLTMFRLFRRFAIKNGQFHNNLSQLSVPFSIYMSARMAHSFSLQCSCDDRHLVDFLCVAASGEVVDRSVESG